MLLVRTDGIKPSLSGTASATVASDGTVTATDPRDVAVLLASGMVPYHVTRSGTGSPEGVVTATVGESYAQTNGTADTARWIKASGTSNTGWVALGSVQIHQASKTLSADGTGADGAIVGTGAGSLGHTDGVTLVAAVTGKTIVPVALSIGVTFAVAAYTGGGNVTASVGSTALTTVVTKENSFQLGASGTAFAAGAAVAANGLISTALKLVAASAFTQPGTAAGTATVIVSYILA